MLAKMVKSAVAAMARTIPTAWVMLLAASSLVRHRSRVDSVIGLSLFSGSNFPGHFAKASVCSNDRTKPGEMSNP
jgi:hypothetical protein